MNTGDEERLSRTLNPKLPCTPEAEGKAPSLTNRLKASQRLPSAGHTQQGCRLFARSKAFITAPACGTVSVPVCTGGTEALEGQVAGEHGAA